MDITTNGPTVVLSGDFDVRSTFEVRDAIYALLSCEDQVVVDMAEVDTLDLVALRVLLVATRQAAIEGRELVLRNCSGQVLRMIHLARVAHAVAIEREVASA